MTDSVLLNRRSAVLMSSFLAASALSTNTASVWAQGGKAPASKTLVIGQIVDTSVTQQDVSKDFLIGSRAAWQAVNLKGGIRGVKVTHLTIETDGTPAGVRQALDSAQRNPDCIALSGCVGDRVATQLMDAAINRNLGMANAAPWLQSSDLVVDDKTFPIFAPRRAQITFALKTLAVMGLQELGAVYGSAQDYAAHHQELEKIAASLRFKLQPFQGGSNLRQLGQKLTFNTPAVLLFLGGTPELADFTKGLDQQARQRYIVALADVNLQVLKDMGAARGTPIVATQPVPLDNAALPVVRAYRETLARLFDEPPTALSLAGYIAARYTYEVLASVDTPLTRETALAAFQKRSDLDLGGFRISFDAQRRGSSYVTQSMLARDGRMIG